jgi:hypothetical protein
MASMRLTRRNTKSFSCEKETLHEVVVVLSVHFSKTK